MSSTPDSIKKLASEGKIEEALEALVALLENNPEYAELANAARVNQADLFQMKSQVIKGTVSNEEARLVNNKVTDNLLMLLRNYEQGKTSLTGPEANGVASNNLRYWLLGTVALLIIAFVGWKMMNRGKNEPVCPNFGNKDYKVMILPLRKGATQSSWDAEFDIMDRLNAYIKETPGLSAVADVNEQFDTQKYGYPNPEEASIIAQNCNAQIVVWGRVKSDSSIYVQYKIPEAHSLRTGKDTSLKQLFSVTDQGSFSEGVREIVMVLYTVLANQANVPLKPGFMDDFEALQHDTRSLRVDTSALLVLADAYLSVDSVEKAIREYDRILEVYPKQKTALVKRGALLYEKEDYEGAARDFEAAYPDPDSTMGALQEVRIDAYIKSNQVVKAQEDIDALKDKKITSNKVIEAKQKELSNAKSAFRKSIDKINANADRRAANESDLIKAGKANLALDDYDKAISYARRAQAKDNKNPLAYSILLDAFVRKGEVENAQKVISEAKEAGADLSKLDISPSTKKALEPEKRRLFKKK